MTSELCEMDTLLYSQAVGNSYNCHACLHTHMMFTELSDHVIFLNSYSSKVTHTLGNNRMHVGGSRLTD